MTMYVRTTVPMTLTISDPNQVDDVLLDGNHEIALLPLWAAQRDEFQILWQDGKVEVSLDPYFDNSSLIITEIPASELPGGGGNYVTADEGGRVPNSALHTIIPLDEVTGTNEANPGTVVRFLGATNAVNHLSISNGASGQSVNLGVISQTEDNNVDIRMYPVGGGKLFVSDVPVLTGVQPINNQGGSALTLHATDAGTLVTSTGSSPCTITVLSNADDPAAGGTVIELAQLGTGQVTVAGAAGVTIHGTPGLKISAQYGAAKLRKIETDVWLLTGDLAS